MLALLCFTLFLLFCIGSPVHLIVVRLKWISYCTKCIVVLVDLKTLICIPRSKCPSCCLGSEVILFRLVFKVKWVEEKYGVGFLLFLLLIFTYLLCVLFLGFIDICIYKPIGVFLVSSGKFSFGFMNTHFWQFIIRSIYLQFLIRLSILHKNGRAQQPFKVGLVLHIS